MPVNKISKIWLSVLFIVGCSFSGLSAAKAWDVEKFYRMSGTPSQDGYGFDHVFKVYFQGIFDGLILSDKINIEGGERPKYCFKNNKIPSSDDIFQIVFEELKAQKQTVSADIFYQTPLVYFVTHAIGDEYSCDIKI